MCAAITAWFETYEFFAIWLEGIALVAIFFLDWKERIDHRKERDEQHQQTLEQLSLSRKLAEASQQQTEFLCWLRVQDRWMDTEFHELRAKIFQRLDDPGQEWTASNIEDAKNMCRRMDEFSRLVPFIGKTFALDTFDDPIAKAWRILEPIVEQERDVARWSRKWECFEKLGKEAAAKIASDTRDRRRDKSAP
jgi:hypothetical protein